MTAAADLGRLVVQCRCERAARWSGEEQAVMAGWKRRRSPEGDVVPGEWLCPDCAPPATPPPAHYRLPDYLRHLIGDGYERAAVEQLELMRSENPARFQACIEDVEREAAAVRARGTKSSPWLRLARRYGAEEENRVQREQRPKRR